MEDILSRPRVARLLVELRKVHPKPMGATQAMRATGYFSRDLKKLLRDCLQWGLIRVVAEPLGNTSLKEITLTPKGLEGADALMRFESIALSARTDAPPLPPEYADVDDAED